ncbi:hypothetical protein LZC95_16050 [Pendulispora brunnea]|uniref:Uncharacterized protein n=1 Tax=Pendulispora brunnea TaxID=2905690 RepID=A0ABZ2KIF3_9BACT
MNPVDPNANPYAAPQTAPAYVPAHGYGHAPSPAFYTYREGDAVVHPRRAWLPAVCMKCARVDGLVTRDHKFQYTPPWTYGLFFALGPVAVLIVMALLRNNARMPIPLCAPCDARWRKTTIVLWSTVGLMVALPLLAIFAAAVSEVAGQVLLALSGVALVALLVVSLVVVRPAQLRAKKIDHAHVWILGVHQDVLERLPSQFVG